MRGAWRWAVPALTVALVGLAPGGPAAADDPLPDRIVCSAAAVVTVIPAPPGPAADQWQITGRGSCVGDGNGTYFADVSGLGSSDTLGECDGTAFVQNLELAVTVTLTSTSNPVNNKVLTETWGLPLTTFPRAVPFLVSDGGMLSSNDFVGGGTIFTRIAGQCPPLGNPAGQIVWARTL
jgi:hypothetical protein